MKRKHFYCFGLITLSLFTESCKKSEQDIPSTTPGANDSINTAYSKAAAINQLVKQYTGEGIPGISIAVYTQQEGWWETTSGYAKIEDQTPMQPKHLHYLQSISKTYMATAILQLWEEGKIDLDAPITKYLSAQYSNLIAGAAQVNVRQLLNHTSGIAEYSDQPEYTTNLIQHPDRRYTPYELLEYIKGKDAQFISGARYKYTNTNYLLLALIADAITGNHAQYIDQKIIQPLHLSQTFYRYDASYPDYPNLVNSYLDRFSNGVIENASVMQKNNVSSMIGDDGFIATPKDAVLFLRGLFEHKLLSPAAEAQMLTWVKNKDGEDTYGMGIYHVVYSNTVGYGHGGSGIGEGCGLYYFPSKQLYVFMGTNLGTIVEGPLVDKIDELKGKVLDVMLAE